MSRANSSAHFLLVALHFAIAKTSSYSITKLVSYEVNFILHFASDAVDPSKILFESVLSESDLILNLSAGKAIFP